MVSRNEDLIPLTLALSPNGRGELLLCNKLQRINKFEQLTIRLSVDAKTGISFAVWYYFALMTSVWYLSLKERIQEGGMRE